MFTYCLQRMFKKEMNLSSILSNLRISRSTGYGYRNASNTTSTVLTDVDVDVSKNSLLKRNPSKHEAIRNMFNNKLRGKLSKVYIEWRTKQVSDMVQIVAKEINPLLEPKDEWDFESEPPSYAGLDVLNMASDVSDPIFEDMMKKKPFKDEQQNMKTIHLFEDMKKKKKPSQLQVEENKYESKQEVHKNEKFWNFYEFVAMEHFCRSINLHEHRGSSDFLFEWLRTKSERSKFDNKSERIQHVKVKSEYETSSEADSQTVFDSRENVGHTIRSDGEGTSSLREAKWMEPLRLSRIDWVALRGGLKQHTMPLYYKVEKLVLGEESLQTKMGDYSMLVDAQGIIKKMNIGGIAPVTTILNRYIMGGNPDHAKDALECLRSQGFQLDTKVINSMIMACINAGEPKLGESLMTVAESTGVQLTEEMYMALLLSYSQLGDADGAIRIATGMDSSGFLPSVESCNLLVRVSGRAGKPHQARTHFDRITKLALVPDKKCVANMLVAYERKELRNQLVPLAQEVLEFGVHYFNKEVKSFTTVLDDCLASSIQLRGKTKLLGRKIEQLLVKIDEKRQ